MRNKVVESCSARIKNAMVIRDMKQADLCRITKIPKSAISEYLSGAYEPKQDKLLLLSRALRVSPAWLMGYDVPMTDSPAPAASKLTEAEEMLLNLFRQVPEDQQELVLHMIQAALKSR
jgi:transcriptional regulator with XRE-family HTH domain